MGGNNSSPQKNKNQILHKYLRPTSLDNALKKKNDNNVPTSDNQRMIEELKPKKSLKSRRNQRLIKALNEFVEGPEITPKTEEEQKNSKGSTTSLENNVVYNLMKKSHSRSNSNKRSSDNNDRLSNLSDLRNNSLNEGKSPEPKSKTEKSLSNNTCKNEEQKMSPLLKIPLGNVSVRKDSEHTFKTDDVEDKNRKFSRIATEIKNNHRSKSFTKPGKNKEKKHCKRKAKKLSDNSGEDKSKHSDHSKHSRRHKHHKHRHQCSKKSRRKNKSDHKESNSSSSHSKTPTMQSRKIQKTPMYKASTPKMTLRRNYMADNLKLKAEELIQRRINKERRKNTEDYQIEKLTINKNPDSAESEDLEANPVTLPDKTMIKLKRHHKESMAKPLGDDSEDESPISRKRSPSKYYKDMRVSENISRLMDDKRSTIKEQVEDEEEFTGSSLNISGNLHFIRGSKH